ncbi:pilus assembly protein PilY [Pseudomonas nitroreducens]|uniref:Pilus assembly protein PilY n=1 Tax=Pseudomonas nitroreducens TaxID=46680 RepID=A0A5R9AGC3_PSENT|nr:PilC/PilY family type IV pilus protein [Pseudomonas nitroreducens]TLP77829.1 pilus assembly protein PilY [Pseudomonas nitroreducens]
MNRPQSFLRSLMSGALLTSGIACATLSYADDTEIFFGGQSIDQNVRPNVLFVLDNSGSMAWRTDSNNNPSRGQQSRMTLLKQAFADIIQNTNGINAGLMVLNGDNRLLYPVTNIDSVLPSSATQYAGNPEIGQGSDDATQNIANSTGDLGESSLPMGYTSTTTTVVGTPNSTLAQNDAFFIVTQSGTDYACRMRSSGTNRPSKPVCTNGNMTELNINSTNNSNYQTALFDFRSLGVPASATIQSAYLVLVPTNGNSRTTPPTLNVRMELSKTPAALNDNNPVGTRTFNTASATASSWINGNAAQIDITNQLRALQRTAPATSDIGDVVMSFRATQAADYTFCARSCSTNATPALVVNYSSTSTVSQTRIGALRFQNLGIPQGATVTKAVLSFVPATSNSDPVTFRIKGQLASDATTFSATENLPARATTSAYFDWAAPEWTAQNPPVPVAGPDIKNVVQQIVNQAGWCGNNSAAIILTPQSGTGSRTATSIEGGIGLQPTLTVTYTGGTSGCLNPIIETRVTDAKNDGFETAPGRNYYTPTLGDNTLPLNSGSIAARYENLPIIQGATVLDAKLYVTPSNTVAAPNVTTSISFENTDSSAALQATSGNIGSRSSTSGVSCTINNANGGWTSGTSFACGGLTSSLQTVFNRSGWAPGSALTVFMTQSANSSLNAQAYEANPAQSLRLRIKLASGGMTTSPFTVRNQLNNLAQSMTPEGSTPIVPTLYDAVQYLRNGADGYSSPINSACQTTHMVLLTDGQANQNTTAAKNGIAALTGACSSDASDDGEKCARTLAGWIAANDQASSIDGDNQVTTHTVGFALDASGATDSANIKRFLADLASRGGGSTYTATTAGDLSKAFNDIIQQVLATDSTFVSASAPVNTFNRQDNKDELYFSVFKPQETDTWPGNLKRYRLDTATAQIVDADNTTAVDPLTGFFKSSARSFWSTSADGNNTANGGAASNLPDAAARSLYTFIGSSPSAAVNLNQNNYLLNTANTTITNAKLGITDASDTAARTAAINYIRGLTAAGAQRKALGDPLHSSPRLVTYACNTYSDSTYKTCSSEDQSVVMSTNEGYLHLFNTSNGQEQMAFMPEPLLTHVPQLAANQKSTSAKPRSYGMDNTVTLWVNDANKNGVLYGGLDPSAATPTLLSGLNTGEFVYAYGTMGRGGRDIYALDLTDRANPKLLWLIKGGTTTGFEQLGQTWSPPVKTRIDVGGTITDVLIFAGGYDPNQDGVSIQTDDTMGNAIYIVNAKTGARIWSASKTSGTLQLSKMKYSIPSAVRVIDLQQNTDGTLANDANQLADQFFVGDMGGQVWRFYINNGSSGSGLVTAAGSSNNGVFANVVPADVAATTDDQRKAKVRRFYNEPDVAILNVNGTLVMTVNIGSGYRGHPLNKLTEDRFYSFRTPVLTKPSTSETTLTESSLYDATSNLLQAGNATEKADAASAFSATTGGWMIKMNSSGGEKVLTRALTVNGYLYFNTYEPTAAANSCQASVGVNRSYVVNLADSTPVTTTSGSNSPSDRYNVVKTTGLLPDPTLVCIGGNCFVINGTQVSRPPKLDLSEYYWIDEDNL